MMTVAEPLNIGTDAILFLLIGIIGYFLRDAHQTIKANSKKIKSDDELLQLINGKYLSRRELDLMLRERDEWRQGIVDQMENIEAGLAKSFAQSKEHYEHERNPDAHWTPRERQDLKETLAKILEEIRDLGKRHYGDK